MHGLHGRVVTRMMRISFAGLIRFSQRSSRWVDFAIDMLDTFGFGYKLFLATRPEKGYVGTDEMWDQAAAALEAAMQERGVPLSCCPGEGAFYGPKIEFSLFDAIGRKWTGPTIQVDFNLAKALDATYRDSDDTEKYPVVIHRVVLGSWERFFGVGPSSTLPARFLSG